MGEIRMEIQRARALKIVVYLTKKMRRISQEVPDILDANNAQEVLK